MDEDMGVYFFDVSNSFQSFGGSRSLLGAGVAYVLVGIVCVVNAIVGLALGGVKRFGTAVFFNQHWINISYILTGILVILAERIRLNFYFFTSVTFIIMSTCMAIGVGITDMINIGSMVKVLKNKDSYPNYLANHQYGQLSVMASSIPYNAVDLITNLFALGVSVYSLQKLYQSSRRLFAGHGNACIKLTLIGIVYCIVAVLNLITHIVEASKEHVYSNYTLDQPFWLLVGVCAAGSVVAAGVTGSRPVSHVAFLLSILCYFPTIHFLTFEYRWIAYHLLTKSVALSGTHFVTTRIGLGLNVTFLVCSIFACYFLGNRLANQGTQWFDLNKTFDARLRKTLLVVPATLIVLGGALFAIDIINSVKEALFRILMASDQRLPFSLIPAGVLTLAINRDSPITYLLYPLNFALCIIGLSSTMLNINSFLFLANKLYTAPDIVCDYLFLSPRPCEDVINYSNTNSHFLQALLSFIAGLLSICLAVILGRIMGLYGLPANAARNLSVEKQTWVHRQIVAIRSLGGAHAALGLLAVSLVGVVAKKRITPLTSDFVILQNYVIFSGYYVAMICTGIVSLVWSSNDIHRFPLRLMAIMMLNAVRIIELFIYLDYRTVNGVNMTLSLIILGEIVSLGISFATILLSGHLLFSTSTSTVPDFDFGENDPENIEIPPDDMMPSQNLEAEMYNPDLVYQPSGVLDMRND